MNPLHVTLSALLLTLPLLHGCSDKEAPPATTDVTQPATAESAAPAAATTRYKVADTFKIGDAVVARSLALETASNTLWVGTSGGVLEIDMGTQKPRNTYTREHGLANEYVFGIYIDSRGDKWFGTNGGGVSRLSGGQWKTFFPMHGLADYWIYTFTEQADGSLWIGTWAGANRYDPNTEKFTTYVKELINEWVYGLDVDSRDRVWFGTEGGVSMYDGSAWHEWNHDDGMGAANNEALPPSTNTGLGTRSRHDLSTLRLGSKTYNPNYVFSILVDERDHVWAGTWGGGAARYDGKGWHNLTTADGLAGNIVYSIAYDSEGGMWFGTDGGLSRLHQGKWQNFGRKEGLAAEHVYAIQALPNGEVWAATQGGVSRLLIE